MQQRRANASKSPIVVSTPDKEKVEMIRTGKKKKTITGFKENTNVKLVQDGSKVIAVQKEKKVEEAGVTRKKRNYVMYESKLGTEKETDYTKIAAKKMKAPKPRVEEKIVQKRKVKEYLDNYQYHETKSFKSPNPKPALVVHQRLGDKIGGTFEEITYEKFRTIQTPQSKPSDVLRAKQSTFSRNQRMVSPPLARPYNTQTQPRQTRNTQSRKMPNTPTVTRSQPRGQAATTTTKTYNVRTVPRKVANTASKPPEGTNQYTSETHTRVVTKGGKTTKTTTTRVTSGRKK
jgi:hypothetical protein